MPKQDRRTINGDKHLMRLIIGLMCPGHEFQLTYDHRQLRHNVERKLWKMKQALGNLEEAWAQIKDIGPQ